MSKVLLVPKSLLILAGLCVGGLTVNNNVATAAAHADDQNVEFRNTLYNMQFGGGLDPTKVLTIPPCEEYYVQSSPNPGDPNQVRIRDGLRIRVTGFVTGDKPDGKGNWAFAKIKRVDGDDPTEYYLYIYG